MSDARRYAVCRMAETKVKVTQGKSTVSPHGTNFSGFFTISAQVNGTFAKAEKECTQCRPQCYNKVHSFDNLGKFL